MNKIHAYTKTKELYIINKVHKDFSTSMIGWENSEKSARKAVENLDEFYPCGEPKYVIIDQAVKDPEIDVAKRIWYKRAGNRYEEFAGLRQIDNEQI